MKTNNTKNLRNASLFCLITMILSIAVYAIGFYAKNGFDLSKLFGLGINLFVFGFLTVHYYRDYKRIKAENMEG